MKRRSRNIYDDMVKNKDFDGSVLPGAKNQPTPYDFENRKTRMSVANLQAIEESKLGAFELKEGAEEEDKA